MNRGPFAKVYRSLWDGSLAPQPAGWALFVFMLAHCDHNGVVDMAPNAIARRSGLSIGAVRRGLSILLEVDPESRGEAEDGRRIVLLSPRRKWGWRIVNYPEYRAATPAERKASQRWRDRHGMSRPVTGRHHAEVEEEVEEEKKTTTGPGPKGPGAQRARKQPKGAVEVVRLTTNRAEEFPIWSTELEEWRATFPAVDVAQELREMRAWLSSNPENRKTWRGMLAFVVRWLGREQDKAKPAAAKSGHRRGVDRRYRQQNPAGGG